MPEDHGHRIRHHVQLPGGRQIEVVYLDSSRHRPGEESPCAADEERKDGASTTWHAEDGHPSKRAKSDTPVAPKSWTGDSPTTAPGEALHVCPRCAGGLVHPLDWVEESPGRWRISMRCPDCDLLREDVFGQALVERLDEELDRATGALLGDLKQITHANMVEEIELFSRALELDLIGPSDF
ncbi:MAG TPA: hypothetical protein VFV03_09245 [Solirubrobacteraceae bacterium]|nr:hypothetical protein [Solirubrobacteraceae bacterium]